MTGRRGIAPCGHEGEYVIGTYVQCTRGCDRVAVKAAPKAGAPQAGSGGLCLICRCPLIRLPAPMYVHFNAKMYTYTHDCPECQIYHRQESSGNWKGLAYKH